MAVLIVPFEHCTVFAQEAKGLEEIDQVTFTAINEYDFYLEIRKMSITDAAETYCYILL